MSLHLSDLYSAGWRSVHRGWRRRQRMNISPSVHRWGIAVETGRAWTHCARQEKNMLTGHRHQRASHIIIIMNKRLLKRQYGWLYLYKCLCCAESFVLRKYLCGGSRAAKVGQGHGSIIDLPSLLTAYCGWPTINTDLYSREPCGSQRMLNNRRFIFSLYRIQQD